MLLKCIAVVGVSGVGKTTLIERFVTHNPGFRRVSASQILKSNAVYIANSEGWFEAQWRIARKVKIELESMNGHVLFDSHCVIEFQNEFLKVPCEVFQEMRTSGIVLITRPSAEVIASNRLEVIRIRQEKSIAEIDRLKELELEAARECAVRLKIPLRIVTELNDFTAAVVSIASHS